MKNFVFLLSLGFGLFASGCTDTSGNSNELESLRVRNFALEARIDTLAGANERLTEELQLRNDFLESYTRLINQTLGQLDAITEREGILRQIRLEVESTEGRRVNDAVTIEHRINDNLAAIQQFIEKSKRERDALARQHQQLARLAEERGTALSGLQETVHRLNALIAAKEQAIQELRKEADRMLARISSLQEVNTELAEENTELREAYYVVGTREQLEEQEIIDRRGGFLSIGRKTHINKLDAQHFAQVNVETREVFVGTQLKEYKILTNQRESAGLFAFEEREGGVYLSILNPEQFWKISRFLVIEVER